MRSIIGSALIYTLILYPFFTEQIHSPAAPCHHIWPYIIEYDNLRDARPALIHADEPGTPSAFTGSSANDTGDDDEDLEGVFRTRAELRAFRARAAAAPPKIPFPRVPWTGGGAALVAQRDAEAANPDELAHQVMKAAHNTSRAALIH